jgi:hypothetical protein
MPSSVGKNRQQHKRLTDAIKSDECSAGNDEHGAFADRLRLIASRLGSMRALARAAGVHPTTAHAWFGTAEPGRAALSNLARAANVSLDWLVSGEGNYALLKFFDLQKSEGYNEAFIAAAGDRAETRLFDLSTLKGPLAAQNLPIAERIETWQDPVRARENLFLLLVGGSGDLMAPLIQDGDLILTAGGMGTEVGLRKVTYPCVMSHKGRVIIRLVRYPGVSDADKIRAAIGPIDRSAWPPKMAKPEYLFRGGHSPNSSESIPSSEFRMLGRVIWCGRSLLTLDFSS